MASLVAWNQLIAESQRRGWPCDFALIYIEEAHAEEGWTFHVQGGAAMPAISYARALKERIAAAKEMRRRYDAQVEAPSAAAGRESQLVTAAGQRPEWLSPVYVDSMSDSLCRAYHARPERLYVLHGSGESSHSSAASSTAPAPAVAAAAAATVVYQGGEGPFGYSLKDMMRAVHQMDNRIDMRWQWCVQ